MREPSKVVAFFWMMHYILILSWCIPLVTFIDRLDDNYGDYHVDVKHNYEMLPIRIKACWRTICGLR